MSERPTSVGAGVGAVRARPATAGATLFHTGLLVADLDDAAAAYTQALGLHWTGPMNVDSAMLGPFGPTPRSIRVTYSVEGPHHIELIEIVDDTAYRDLPDGPSVHHLGFHTPDIVGQARKLEAAGFRRYLSTTDHISGKLRATFHHNPVSPGMLIELVDALSTAPLEHLMHAAAEKHDVPFVSPFGTL